MVTVEYVVAAQWRTEFVAAMHQYERVRRRDGASRWGISHDTEVPDRYLEIFLVDSWAEHLRRVRALTRTKAPVVSMVPMIHFGQWQRL